MVIPAYAAIPRLKAHTIRAADDPVDPAVHQRTGGTSCVVLEERVCVSLRVSTLVSSAALSRSGCIALAAIRIAAKDAHTASAVRHERKTRQIAMVGATMVRAITPAGLA